MDTDKLPVIETLFVNLKALGAVRSTDDFSVNWLGMDKSYLRCLRARNRNPTPRVLANCNVRLLDLSERLTANHQPSKIRKVGRRLKELADLCVCEYSTESEA